MLIIDDDVALLSRLGAQLELAGFTVEQSSDLAHGERRCAEWQPDLVILEVRTGNDAGWEALPRLTAQVPVLVLTGASREEDVVRAFGAGAVDVVAKPYRSGELQVRLRVRLNPPVALAVAAPDQKPPKTTTTHPLPNPARPQTPAANDEAIFMSEAEEMAMLRATTTPAHQATQAPLMLDVEAGIGARMRAERLRRHLTLVQLENELKIRLSYLQAMEDEKFTLLPRGPAAIQMVRSYADYLGLDGSAAANQFKAQGLGDAVAPLPALGGSAIRRPPPRWLVILVAVLLALIVGIGAILAFDPSFFEQLPNFFSTFWAQLQTLWPSGE
ncbi:MAG: response regulator [Oscillochloridaceae bacterium umkhey_bin13]